MNKLKTVKLWAFVLFVAATFNAQADYIRNLPTTIQQPDGTEIECFSSGDEVFNWLHDIDGYIIIQSQKDGYYYYAQYSNGSIVASKFLVGSIDGAKTGLEKWIKIPIEEYKKIKEEREKYIDAKSSKSLHSGTINNIVIYIKFNDDSDFTIPRSVFDNTFNSSTYAPYRNGE